MKNTKRILLTIIGLIIIAVTILFVKDNWVPQYNIEGIWHGTFDINGKGDFDFTALYLNGKAIAVSNDANVVYQGDVSHDGKKFDSTLNMYIKNKNLFGQVALSGNILDPQTIDSTFITKDVSDRGKLKLVSQDEQYNKAISIDGIVANWILYQGFTIIQFAIEQNGNIRGADTIGCAYEGKITVINPDKNAYQLVMLISSCPSEGSFSGMAYLSSSIEENDTLNLHLFDEESGFFLPIVRNNDTRSLDKNRDWGKSSS